MNKQDQTLFDNVPDWKREWVGMPEFIQDNLNSKFSIKVHFRTYEDMQAFAKFLGQTITPKQKALWYPEMKPRVASDKRYVDEP